MWPPAEPAWVPRPGSWQAPPAVPPPLGVSKTENLELAQVARSHTEPGRPRLGWRPRRPDLPGLLETAAARRRTRREEVRGWGYRVFRTPGSVGEPQRAPPGAFPPPPRAKLTSGDELSEGRPWHPEDGNS